jgi:cell wall-associated NlpC family hydrolase
MMTTKELIQSYYDSLIRKDSKWQDLYSDGTVFSDASRFPMRKLFSIFSALLILTLSVLACSMPGAAGGGDNTAMPPTVMLSFSTPTVGTNTSTANTTPVAAGTMAYHYARLSDPPRTQVTDADGHWLATFTDNAYTVTLSGEERTFTEPNAKDPVISTVWVRVLPVPFNGTVDENWLSHALNDHSPDVLAIAMQYITGAPPITDSNGLQFAGNASYGPVAADDTREEGGDFNDYLGIAWTFGGITHQPRVMFFRSMDCSGFMRMVWGYRSGLPLTYVPNGGKSIPRHSWEILSSGPGIVIIPDINDSQVTDFSHLAPGDLVFFHAKTEAHDPQIDHIGMYLGQDTAGNYRFISSRQKADGPTMGDFGGNSLLNGKGLYAQAFRAARRF